MADRRENTPITPDLRAVLDQIQTGDYLEVARTSGENSSAVSGTAYVNPHDHTLSIDMLDGGWRHLVRLYDRSLQGEVVIIRVHRAGEVVTEWVAPSAEEPK